MNNGLNTLIAISPIDGRYRDKGTYKERAEDLLKLSEYVSEYALIKARLGIEVNYLLALSKISRTKLSPAERKKLLKVLKDFNLEEADKIKRIEDVTRHDVKAIEIYLGKFLSEGMREMIHFGLTTEDINNLAYRLLIKESLEKILLPAIVGLQHEIFKLAKKYKNLPMLGRTHGQAAVPTILGKELVVFVDRLKYEIEILQTFKLRGKLNGAIGNYNALNFAYPKINWRKFSKDFISSFGLDFFNQNTTQIAPYEDIIYLFQTLERINGIVLDFNQDMWRYISDAWLIQENIKGEIGSSTMPQKINPIMFENSEGNLILANSLIDGFVNKLPISRLQRDMSGSTISRNFGVCLAYCLLAYKNCLSGLSRVRANEQKIKEDLNSDWSILSEAVQIYLKKHGIKKGYEILKDLTRGQKMNQEEFKQMIDKLPLNNKQKSELKKLSPENYIGIF